MKTSTISKAGPILGVLIMMLSTGIEAQEKNVVKNVVLVHGAFVDGSGYKKLFQILSKKSYNVTVVQNSLSSLEDDIYATKSALDKQDGPTILVGHSYAGAVITQAGNHPNVAALVYVAAFQPDSNQSALDQGTSLPASPENGILPPDDKGIFYYDKEKFHAGFCADLSKEDTDFMWASQGMFSQKAFSGKVSNASWHKKPTYGIIATEDKSINPDILRKAYKNSNTKTIEIKSSHVVFITHAKEVAAVIIQASKETKQ